MYVYMNQSVFRPLLYSCYIHLHNFQILDESKMISKALAFCLQPCTKCCLKKKMGNLLSLALCVLSNILKIRLVIV